MRKSIEDVTEAEKKEAKRRIQGNFALEGSPSDSGEEEQLRKRRVSVATVHTLAASAL